MRADPVMTALARGLAGDAREAWMKKAARSQMHQALFGVREPVRVGRYVIDAVLGDGGGGDVYRAHDPGLRRDVAVKRIELGDRPADVVLAEARTLAALEHPSIVRIYDVMAHDGALWIATELASSDLHRWSSERRRAGRSVRWETVASWFVALAEALATVHRAGRSHRDVKPANVLVRGDGTVALTDFGLALVAARGAGTVGYLAPELRDPSAALDLASTDQFAFFRTLTEVLTGHPDATSDLEPRRLRVIAERGTSAEAARRFDDMQAVAAALRRVTGRGGTRWALAGAVAVGLAASALVGAASSDTSAAPGAVGSLTWDHEQRAVLEGRGQSETLVAIDGYANAWHDANARAKDADSVVHACLEHRRRVFNDTVELVLEDVGRDARSAVAAMVDPQRCWGPGADVPTSRVVARGIALGNAGRYDDAAALLRERLGDASGSERAWIEVQLGKVETTLGNFDAARDRLQRGYELARDHELVSLAANAAASLVLVEGVHGTRYAVAEQWGQYALALADRLPEPGEARGRALLFLGRMARAREHRAEADAWLREAVEVRRAAFGEQHEKFGAVAMELGNLLHDTGNDQEAAAWLDRACRAYESSVGETHPDYAACLVNRGLVAAAQGKLSAAETDYRQALAIATQVFGPGQIHTATALAQLADLARQRGDHDAAVAAYREALAVYVDTFDGPHPRLIAAYGDFGIALAGQGDLSGAIGAYSAALNLARTLDLDNERPAAFVHLNRGTAFAAAGDPTAALAEYARAETIAVQRMGATHLLVAATHLNRASAELQLGRAEQAREEVERATALLEVGGHQDHPYFTVARDMLAEL